MYLNEDVLNIWRQYWNIN